MLGTKTGECKICKRKSRTEWHHIISQFHSIRTNQEHLLDNPDNVIELCIRCHKQTTASMVRKRLTKLHGPVTRTRRARRPSPQEKTAARRNEAQDRRKRMQDSIEKMSKRGASTSHKRQSSHRTIKRLRRFFPGEVADIEMKMLYPTDHWLHSPQDFIPSLSKRFERDWVWAKGGGAHRKECLLQQNIKW